MALPSIKVEIAFDSGFATAEGSRTWTDVSAYVEGSEEIGITYGRADELSTPDPNQLTLTLDNRDGRFTPEKASSPYYPNVKKGKPIRVSVTYNAVSYTRFTGYVDEWPLVWPDGSSAAATVTITASSRRARLGQTAELQYSPIRYAYALPDWPQAYWPMDGTRVNRFGQEFFIDVTNIGTPLEFTDSRLAVYTSTAALQPVFDGSTPGPVDELPLLKFPKFTDAGLLGNFAHYVGAPDACKVNTAGEFTLEWLARIEAPADQDSSTTLARISSNDGGAQSCTVYVSHDSAADTGTVAFTMGIYDVSTGTYLALEASVSSGYETAAFAAAIDGNLHHYALTLTGGDTGKLYFDGVLLDTLTFPGAPIFDLPFTQLSLGDNTWMASAWVGHVAVRDEALSAAEIAAHAAAATTSDETIEERLQRLAGYVGVPAAEVEAEDSVTIGVGDQTQKGRSPIAVADELAASTGGVLYDTRAGHLFMQARNHRYNQTAAFTLNVTTQEVEGNLELTSDDRYLVNYVTVSRTGVDDLSYWEAMPTSSAEYGFYSQTLEVATSSWEEARSAADNLIVRYSTPQSRVSTVAVDVVNLSTSQQAAVLNADIGTLFNIASLPAQAPTDPMPLYPEGYTETLSAKGHTISFNTTPGNWFTNVAVLDDASHDVLGSGITTAY